MKRTTIIMIILAAAGLLLTCVISAVIATAGGRVELVSVLSRHNSPRHTRELPPFDAVNIIDGDHTFVMYGDDRAPLLIKVNPRLARPRITMADSLKNYLHTSVTRGTLQLEFSHDMPRTELTLDMQWPVLLEVPEAPRSITTPNRMSVYLTGAQASSMNLTGLRLAILNGCAIDSLMLDAPAYAWKTRLDLDSCSITHVNVSPDIASLRIIGYDGNTLGTVSAMRTDSLSEGRNADFTLSLRNISAPSVIYNPGENQGSLVLSTTGAATAALDNKHRLSMPEK